VGPEAAECSGCGGGFGRCGYAGDALQALEARHEPLRAVRRPLGSSPARARARARARRGRPSACPSARRAAGAMMRASSGAELAGLPPTAAPLPRPTHRAGRADRSGAHQQQIAEVRQASDVSAGRPALCTSPSRARTPFRVADRHGIPQGVLHVGAPRSDEESDHGVIDPTVAEHRSLVEQRQRARARSLGLPERCRLRASSVSVMPSSFATRCSSP